ncbi:hypothetical protein BDZ91DRAFT_742088, partial [Kalaharituber pfeilii]
MHRITLSWVTLLICLIGKKIQSRHFNLVLVLPNRFTRVAVTLNTVIFFFFYINTRMPPFGLWRGFIKRKEKL